MYIIRNYTIPNAALTALSNGTFYWITGANISANQTPRLVQIATPPLDYFDLGNYDYLKVYISTTGLTTAAGGTLSISEMWPDPSQTVGNSTGQMGTFTVMNTIAATATNTVFDISQYATPSNVGGQNGAIYKFCRATMTLGFTTVPTAGGALNIILAGERYGHEG